MGELKEEVITLTLLQAGQQALWDLRQWTKDHLDNCQCFTCGETIPDLITALVVIRGFPASD